MTDIVERLLSGRQWLNGGECCGQLDDSGTCAAPACIFGEALKHMHEAADEIERLRAERDRLREALRFYGGHDPDNSDHGKWVERMNEDGGDIARAALGEDRA